MSILVSCVHKHSFAFVCSKAFPLFFPSHNSLFSIFVPSSRRIFQGECGRNKGTSARTFKVRKVKKNGRQKKAYVEAIQKSGTQSRRYIHMMNCASLKPSFFRLLPFLSPSSPRFVCVPAFIAVGSGRLSSLQTKEMTIVISVNYII